MHLLTCSSQFDWEEKLHGISCPPPTNNSNRADVYANFDDIRDAVTAFGEIELVNPNWSVKYITQTEYASGRKGGNQNGLQEPSSFHDGQVVFKADFNGLSSEFTLDGLFDKITELAGTFGEVIGVAEMNVDAGNRQYRAEYYKITAAQQVLSMVTEKNPGTFGVSSTSALYFQLAS